MCQNAAELLNRANLNTIFSQKFVAKSKLSKQNQYSQQTKLVKLKYSNCPIIGSIINFLGVKLWLCISKMIYLEQSIINQCLYPSVIQTQQTMFVCLIEQGSKSS
eukprot:TRINITY_DN71314_c0_g1_i1.p7 TRINITY_DN71314_c0_g1~~TRINITY_DN71314_c0_g1_i1.p7  ORF type:complete len:105 (+),score=0.66 TRINITY_DN71314_c0_g1_i1:1116-1430(+)